MKPLNDNVLVDPIHDREIGLIYTPEAHKLPPTTGMVIAVGDKVQDCKVGDKVFFQRGKLKIEVSGKELYLFHEVNVLAIIEE